FSQVLPRAAHAAHLRLSAQLPFGAHLACDAGDLRGERVELIDHRVDGVLQFENLAFDVDGNRLRQITVRNGGRHFGDVAYLTGEVRGHVVHGIGEVFPCAADAGYFGLSAQPPFRADLPRDAGDFGGNRAELIDHRVSSVL